jgi:hypothetical protein
MVPPMHLSVNFLLRHANPLEQVALAARRAAVLEAQAQLAQLEALNLDREPPEHRVRVQRWCKELRQLIDLRRRG